MKDAKGRHMDKDSRVAIEEGINNGDSARAIAAAVGVSPSTVTREVLANRTVAEPGRRAGANLSVRCARYRDCERAGTACEGCKSAATPCRSCRTRSCIDSCPDFELRMCERVSGWPYVCPPKCPRRPSCRLPKCRYRAEEAQRSHDERLSSSRSGADVEPGRLEEIAAVVAALAAQGHSFEAIVAAHGDEIGVTARTLYNWQEAGLLGLADIDLPRKARLRPRKRRAAKGRPRVDRSGREYADFLALPIEERARVVQGDSVEGYAHNAHDVLSLHLVARAFQLYMRKLHADPADTVRRMDEVVLKSGDFSQLQSRIKVTNSSRLRIADSGRIKIACAPESLVACSCLSFYFV